MSKIEDVTAYDNVGESYTFGVYPKVLPTGREFKNVAGVYMFLKKNSNQKYDILYIGETESFRDRPLGWGHQKWGSATREGMTHICVLETPNRVSIQNKLIAAYNPPLNKQ